MVIHARSASVRNEFIEEQKPGLHVHGERVDLFLSNEEAIELAHMLLDVVVAQRVRTIDVNTEQVEV